MASVIDILWRNRTDGKSVVTYWMEAINTVADSFTEQRGYDLHFDHPELWAPLDGQPIDTIVEEADRQTNIARGQLQVHDAHALDSLCWRWMLRLIGEALRQQGCDMPQLRDLPEMVEHGNFKFPDPEKVMADLGPIAPDETERPDIEEWIYVHNNPEDDDED